jgi:hypothetical protein
MQMRVERQWVSYNMTSHKWVTATLDYNTRLESHNKAAGHETVPKNPRALMDKLGEIEPIIVNRVTRGDFEGTAFFLSLSTMSSHISISMI